MLSIPAIIDNQLNWEGKMLPLHLTWLSSLWRVQVIVSTCEFRMEWLKYLPLLSGLNSFTSVLLYWRRRKSNSIYLVMLVGKILVKRQRTRLLLKNDRRCYTSGGKTQKRLDPVKEPCGTSKVKSKDFFWHIQKIGDLMLTLCSSLDMTIFSSTVTKSTISAQC